MPNVVRGRFSAVEVVQPQETVPIGRQAMRCECGSTNWMIFDTGDVECVDCEAEPECPTRGLVRLHFPEAVVAKHRPPQGG